MCCDYCDCCADCCICMSVCLCSCCIIGGIDSKLLGLNLGCLEIFGSNGICRFLNRALKKGLNLA